VVVFKKMALKLYSVLLIVIVAHLHLDMKIFAFWVFICMVAFVMWMLPQFPFLRFVRISGAVLVFTFTFGIIYICHLVLHLHLVFGDALFGGVGVWCCFWRFGCVVVQQCFLHF